MAHCLKQPVNCHERYSKICKILLSFLPHVVISEYKMRTQTRLGIEAFQELSWLPSTIDSSSFPLSLVSERLLREESCNI